jgi:hypothetical protein
MTMKSQPRSTRSRIPRQTLSDAAKTEGSTHLVNEVLATTNQLIKTVEALKGEITAENRTPTAKLRETGENAIISDVDINELIKSGRVQSASKKEIADRLEIFRQAMDGIAGVLPTDYASRQQVLVKLSDIAREGVAKLFQDSLNSQAKILPQATYEDKKTLTKWINGELRKIGGIGIKCPNSGEACIIVATTGDERNIQQERRMKSVTRYRRSAFTGIELLIVLIILVIIVCESSTKPADPSASNGQQPVAASTVAGTAQAVKSSAQAGRAVIGMVRAAGDDGTDIVPPAVDPVAPPPAVDPPLVVTSPDVDLDDLIEGFFEGF